MRYLLDSVVWLWSIASPEKINAAALEILENGQEEIYFSAASSWELSIKARAGKLQLPAPPGQCIPAFMAKQGLWPLSVSHLHSVKVFELPAHHNDPFDRMLIAQALVEGLTILTSDHEFEKYGVDVVWCAK